MSPIGLPPSPTYDLAYGWYSAHKLSRMGTAKNPAYIRKAINASHIGYSWHKGSESRASLATSDATQLDCLVSVRSNCSIHT
jgi:hypothetical protein